jgi:hypothetical protein
MVERPRSKRELFPVCATGRSLLDPEDGPASAATARLKITAFRSTRGLRHPPDAAIALVPG